MDDARPHKEGIRMRPIFPRATQGEVQELCEQLDSAKRDLFAGKIDVDALGSETRRVLLEGLDLFAVGTISRSDAVTIHDAVSEANKAIRNRLEAM
jgi:hypothetical protein